MDGNSVRGVLSTAGAGRGDGMRGNIRILGMIWGFRSRKGTAFRWLRVQHNRHGPLPRRRTRRSRLSGPLCCQLYWYNAIRPSHSGLAGSQPGNHSLTGCRQPGRPPVTDLVLNWTIITDGAAAAGWSIAIPQRSRDTGVPSQSWWPGGCPLWQSQPEYPSNGNFSPNSSQSDIFLSFFVSLCVLSLIHIWRCRRRR